MTPQNPTEGEVTMTPGQMERAISRAKYQLGMCEQYCENQTRCLDACYDARALLSLKSQLAEAEEMVNKATMSANDEQLAAHSAELRAEKAEARVKELENSTSSHALVRLESRIAVLIQERDSARAALAEAREALKTALDWARWVRNKYAPHCGSTHTDFLENAIAKLNPASRVMGRIKKLERVADAAKEYSSTDSAYNRNRLRDALADLDKPLAPKQDGEK